MKKEQVLNAIVGKLISEGVLAENYNTNEALMVLSHCVMPIKLQTYLVNCEEEVKVRLEKLSQIKQINATENPESLPRIKQQFTADEAEDYINQEVEKRIKERMPSEMTFEKAEIAAKETDYACFAVEPEGNEINFADAAAFYLEGWNACRSRLLLTQDQKKDKQQVDN
jgi:hypothetical protein